MRAEEAQRPQRYQCRADDHAFRMDRPRVREVVELDADRQERPRRVEEPRRARDERVGPEAEDVGEKD